VGILRNPNVLRGFALSGIAASAMLLGDYFRPGSLACPFDSSCEEVLQSRFGNLLGIPLPVLGVLVFAAILWLSVSRSRWPGRLLWPLALTAGCGGFLLIALQVLVIQRLCAFCLIADLSALACVAVVQRKGRAEPASWDSSFPLLWLAAGTATCGLAVVVWAGGKTSSFEAAAAPVPPQVSSHWLPDKINVIEVADFQCDHCRRMHTVLTRFLYEEGERVHFVRLTAPMPGHKEARHASRAFLCAERHGKADSMAETLFSSPTLLPKACEQIAAALGLNMASFRACVADPALDRQLDAEIDWVRDVSPRGLPVIWVQDRMLFGEQPIESLREALRRAEQRSR
jgi:uncharacterized membrane protein/protein-disulfide isomerase